MAQMNNLPIDEVAKRLSRTFDEDLENLLFDHFKPKADEIVREFARKIARNLKTNIQAYEMRDNPYGGVNVYLVIDGVKNIIGDEPNAT